VCAGASEKCSHGERTCPCACSCGVSRTSIDSHTNNATLHSTPCDHAIWLTQTHRPRTHIQRDDTSRHRHRQRQRHVTVVGSVFGERWSVAFVRDSPGQDEREQNQMNPGVFARAQSDLQTMSLQSKRDGDQRHTLLKNDGWHKTHSHSEVKAKTVSSPTRPNGSQ
jgi:hypothetical protein